MRNEVYVKFAEALGQKKAYDRKQVVNTKFAEALDAQLQKKAAPLVPLKNLSVMQKLVRSLRHIGNKAQPKVNVDNWGKYDPRRLFTTTRTRETNALNSAPDGAAPTGGGRPGEGYGSYMPTYGELRHQGITSTTRLSPGKILAGLGLTGGAAAGTVAAVDKANTPPPTPPSPFDGLWQKILANPKMVAALAGVGLLTAGGIGYAIGSNRSRRPREEY